MSKLFHPNIKKILLGFIFLVSYDAFAAVTITGYLYNTSTQTNVYFSTPYPQSIQSSPTVSCNQLNILIVNTANLEPHTPLFTLSDDRGDMCEVGVTSVHMNTQFEILYATSKKFCVVAAAPNYIINIMPQ